MQWTESPSEWNRKCAKKSFSNVHLIGKHPNFHLEMFHDSQTVFGNDSQSVGSGENPRIRPSDGQLINQSVLVNEGVSISEENLLHGFVIWFFLLYRCWLSFFSDHEGLFCSRSHDPRCSRQANWGFAFLEGDLTIARFWILIKNHQPVAGDGYRF